MLCIDQVPSVTQGWNKSGRLNLEFDSRKFLGSRADSSQPTEGFVVRAILEGSVANSGTGNGQIQDFKGTSTLVIDEENLIGVGVKGSTPQGAVGPAGPVVAWQVSLCEIGSIEVKRGDDGNDRIVMILEGPGGRITLSKPRFVGSDAWRCVDVGEMVAVLRRARDEAILAENRWAVEPDVAEENDDWLDQGTPLEAREEQREDVVEKEEMGLLKLGALAIGEGVLGLLSWFAPVIIFGGIGLAVFATSSTETTDAFGVSTTEIADRPMWISVLFVALAAASFFGRGTLQSIAKVAQGKGRFVDIIFLGHNIRALFLAAGSLAVAAVSLYMVVMGGSY